MRAPCLRMSIFAVAQPLSKARALGWCVPRTGVCDTSMTDLTKTNAVAAAGAPDANRTDERRAVAVACGAHVLHDGFTDTVYIMLPIWQGEFGLGYAALGLM